jgi:hypothetical protein
VKLAYADPPYLGCSKFYDHPDAAKWDKKQTHIDLLVDLNLNHDGWAYSCNSSDLGWALGVFHGNLKAYDVRIAAWVKPFAAFKRNVRCAYTWEPVLFKPARDSSKLGAPVTRDHLAEPITLKRGLVGAKPARFNRWILDLLGYIDGDEVIDLFPGTGGMQDALDRPVVV